MDKASAAGKQEPDDAAQPLDQDDPPRSRPTVATVAQVTLAVLAVFYTLYLAAGIVLPFLFAIVLTLLLAPLKRLLTERLHLPAMLAALLLIVLVLAVILGVASALVVPASSWIARAPESLHKLQDRLGFLGQPVAYVRHAIDQIEHVLQPKPPAGRPMVAVQSSANLSNVGMTVLLGTRAAIGQFFTMAVVLFFTLAEGDSLLRRLVEILPTFGEKRRLVEIAGEIERNISGWLITITAMNVLVGAANGLQMWLVGVPDPLLWGTLAFLLNYVPILGPFTGIVVFFFVGLFSLSSVWLAAVPPAIYLAIHTVEGETVTPLLLARRFTLNPVLVIVSLFFWDWLWGVPGAFLAVPLLAIVKTVADRVPGLAPFGHLLGGAPRAGERGGGNPAG